MRAHISDPVCSPSAPLVVMILKYFKSSEITTRWFSQGNGNAFGFGCARSPGRPEAGADTPAPRMAKGATAERSCPSCSLHHQPPPPDSEAHTEAAAWPSLTPEDFASLPNQSGNTCLRCLLMVHPQVSLQSLPAQEKVLP